MDGCVRYMLLFILDWTFIKILWAPSFTLIIFNTNFFSVFLFCVAIEIKISAIPELSKQTLRIQYIHIYLFKVSLGDFVIYPNDGKSSTFFTYRNIFFFHMCESYGRKGKRYTAYQSSKWITTTYWQCIHCFSTQAKNLFRCRFYFDMCNFLGPRMCVRAQCVIHPWIKQL